MFQATAPRALDSCVTLLTEPNDMPPPYQGTSIRICGRPSPRRFSSMLVSISSFGTFTGGLSGNLNRSLSKPPPELPHWYSKPYSSGGHVAGLRHLPGGQNHVRRPAIVAQDLHHRVLDDPQGRLADSAATQ